MSFEEGYNNYIQGITAAEILEPMLKLIYSSLNFRPVDLSKAKEGLLQLFDYLKDYGNTTNENCWAVDLFFCIDDHWDNDWDDLPDEWQLILNDIGGALHDTINAPNIAYDFDSTPLQLYERILGLPTI